jgi:hypothetical protein
MPGFLSGVAMVTGQWQWPYTYVYTTPALVWHCASLLAQKAGISSWQGYLEEWGLVSRSTPVCGGQSLGSRRGTVCARRKYGALHALN